MRGLTSFAYPLAAIETFIQVLTRVGVRLTTIDKRALRVEPEGILAFRLAQLASPIAHRSRGPDLPFAATASASRVRLD